MEIPDTFLCSSYVSRHVQSSDGFGQDLLKLGLFKDKTLDRILFLQHIHHENRFYQKTLKVTPVNVNKTNE